MAVPIALIMAALQVGVGMYQRNQAKKDADANTIDYEIPDEIKQMLAIAKTQASQSTLPGQAIYENRIDRNASASYAAVRAGAENSGQLLEGAIQINQNSNIADENLALMGVERQDRNIQNYQRALAEMARYQDKEFQIDEYEPYLAEAQRTAAQMAAGNQNMMNAVTSYGATAITQQENKKQNAILQAYLNGTGEGETGGSGTQTMTQSLDSQGAPNINVPQDSLNRNPSGEVDYQQWLDQIESIING